MRTLLKLTTVLVLVFVFANNGYSQSCTSAVIKYSGPTNTTQLTTLLNTTDSAAYPLIYNLPTYVKSSLETYIGFSSAGLPLGMSGSDSNIAHLYSDTVSCSALFSEIFNEVTVVHAYGGGPTVTNITMAQFESMTGGTVYAPCRNWCFNCGYPFSPDRCCYVCAECSGCCDDLIIIGGSWYNVTQ